MKPITAFGLALFLSGDVVMLACVYGITDLPPSATHLPGAAGDAWALFAGAIMGMLVMGAGMMITLASSRRDVERDRIVRRLG